MTTPKVSVLIPTYNYAHFLDETIQSVLNQTFQNYELIIVDNNSTDNTDEVVQKYLSDNRVSFYKNETNIGLVGNWNKCLEYANGEYIKYLCADDKFLPSLLQEFVAVMDKYNNISFVTSNFKLFGLFNDTKIKPHSHLVNGSYVIKSTLYNGSNWIGEPTAIMFRKKDLVIGNFNPEFIYHTDFEFFLRLLTLGDCYVIPDVLYYVRKHPNTETANIKKVKFNTVFTDYKLYKALKNIEELEPIIGDEIDKLIKMRAAECALLMFKVVPNLYKSEDRIIFKKALKIASSEGVIFQTIGLLMNKILKKPRSRYPIKENPSSVSEGTKN
jgi:glycosyltransferase involved in cell wall biosynthesis